jgi:hypothetical protein
VLLAESMVLLLREEKEADIDEEVTAALNEATTT